MMQIIRGVFIGCSAVLGSLLTALYVFQEKMLYFPTIPSREYEYHPGNFALNYRDVDIQTEDNVKLHAWLITRTDSKNSPTLIYFHGNAGNICHRLPDVKLQHTSGFNVLLLSYRGYGRSEGQPSESGFRLDAIAALQYVLDRHDILDTSRIYLFGRSIGGACAIALAASEMANNVLKGLIVENTFTSIDDMIDVVVPFLKFAKPLNRNKWNSLSEIKNLKIPILFIRGMKDELVPPTHTTSLYDAAQNALFKIMHTVEDGGHNDTWRVGSVQYRTAILDFLERVEAYERYPTC